MILQCNAMAPRNQLERELAREVTSQRKGCEHGEEEAAFLYGFLDPTRAARGPMKSEHPTVIVTLSSSTTLTFETAIAEPTSWVEGAPTGTARLEGTPGANTGDMTIACGPVSFIDKSGPSGTVNGAQLFPGFVMSGTTPLKSNAFPASGIAGDDGTTPTAPFGTFVASFPGNLGAGDPGESSFKPLTDSFSDQEYRIVGIRSVMTVNSSLLDSYGQVYISDTGSYYPGKPEDNYKLQNTSPAEITQELIIGESTLYNLPFSNGMNTNRTVSAGAFKYGETYEGGFVPCQDTILDYRNRIPTHCRALTAGTGSRLGQPFLNGPFTVFSLVGIPAATVVTVSTVVALELPVQVKSMIGCFIASARIAMNYAVDWSLLARIPTGGEPGGQVLASVTSPYGKLGFGIASGAFTPPAYERPVNIGVTAPSSTDLVTSATRINSGDVQQDLQTAASGASSPIEHFRKALGSYKSYKDAGIQVLNEVSELARLMYTAKGVYEGYRANGRITANPGDPAVVQALESYKGHAKDGKPKFQGMIHGMTRDSDDYGDMPGKYDSFGSHVGRWDPPPHVDSKHSRSLKSAGYDPTKGTYATVPRNDPTLTRVYNAMAKKLASKLEEDVLNGVPASRQLADRLGVEYFGPKSKRRTATPQSQARSKVVAPRARRQPARGPNKRNRKASVNTK
jgi:hypothetical protein